MSRKLPHTYTLKELAELTASTLSGNPEHVITAIADLENAEAHHASFLANMRYVQSMKDSKAGAIFIDKNTPCTDGRNFLVCEDPSKAFQKVIELFYQSKDPHHGFTGIHPTAIVHPTAIIGSDVNIAPHAVIAKDVKIGDRSSIGSGAFIGSHTTVGNDCIIHPNVVIREYCDIGNRVVIQPGAIIGSCGFGFTTDAKGLHTRLKQTGTVVLEDDVEIGANTTIDRARFTTTRICRGSKIDNLVQIAHGVTIGPDNFIIAQTGIAGSSKTGKHVVLAGQVGVVGHVQIADGVMVAAKSGISKSIQEPGGKYMGSPVVPVNEHHRQHAYLKKIETYVKKIQELEKRVSQLESSAG